VPGRAEELYAKIEADTGTVYPLSSDRSEALKKVSDLFAAEGDHGRAAEARLESLVFAFRETETFGSGGYFGPRYTKADGKPYPDFYSLPPNTQDHLRQRVRTTNNPLHRARYADFLWDKFRDAECAAVAVGAYVQCAEIFVGRGDGNGAARAMRRACHLARQLRSHELQNLAKDAAVRVIERMLTASTTHYVPKVAEAVMGLAETLSPEQRVRLVEALERARSIFAKEKEFHLERGTLRTLRQLHKLTGDEEGERRACCAEGESYEAEGDYKLRLSGPGGGPEVAAHLYELAATHFVNMGETTRAEAAHKKMVQAHAKGPVNFQAFVEGLRRPFTNTGGAE